MLSICIFCRIFYFVSDNHRRSIWAFCIITIAQFSEVNWINFAWYQSIIFVGLIVVELLNNVCIITFYCSLSTTGYYNEQFSIKCFNYQEKDCRILEIRKFLILFFEGNTILIKMLNIPLKILEQILASLYTNTNCK